MVTPFPAARPSAFTTIGNLKLLRKLRTCFFLIQILKLAVKRMLPGCPIAKKQLKKLKIYNGDKHPHDVQKPKIIEFEKLHKRNIVK